MNKNNIIDGICSFVNRELSQEDISYVLNIFEYRNKGEINSFNKDDYIKLEYSISKFYIYITTNKGEIKIQKTAKSDIFKELKNGNFQMKITKKDAKILADLIFSAYNSIE